jgi:hypothetical protein
MAGQAHAEGHRLTLKFRQDLQDTQDRLRVYVECPLKTKNKRVYFWTSTGIHICPMKAMGRRARRGNLKRGWWIYK